jgi:CheY-like chemotaxis protein
LTIGKTIAEMHGGTLTAASPGRGRGATLTLRLPEEANASVAPAPARAVAPRSRKLLVLVVEDHLPTLRLMARLLRSLGHEVQTAASAERAIEIAMAQCPDLIISDIGMPNQSGWSLLRELRERCPEPPLRAIAISGYGADDDVRRSHEAGFLEHLVKPIDVDRLNAAIEQAMKSEST